jgi:hypothetical protein
VACSPDRRDVSCRGIAGGSDNTIERLLRRLSGAQDNEGKGHGTMKYMLLIYQNPDAWEQLPEDERTGIMHEAGAIVGELSESGEWVGGEGLADGSHTRTIRVRDGVPAVTDGPYLESKEHLAGYCLFDCETPQRAVEIALRWPDARHWAVELRPLMGGDGLEM